MSKVLVSVFKDDLENKKRLFRRVERDVIGGKSFKMVAQTILIFVEFMRSFPTRSDKMTTEKVLVVKSVGKDELEKKKKTYRWDKNNNQRKQEGLARGSDH